MVHACAVIGLAGLLGGGGCLWERNVDHRLARVQLGATSRRIATDPPAPTPAPGVARATTTPEVASAPPEAGMIGSLQFTMRLLPHLYAGGEVEAGPLARHGSYFGGAYGVIGGEVTSTRGTLSVELAGGRQWVRHELGALDVPRAMLEPRVRAQLSLTPQITLGGVMGASVLPDERGWMAGLYFGLYSREFDARGATPAR